MTIAWPRVSRVASPSSVSLCRRCRSRARRLGRNARQSICRVAVLRKHGHLAARGAGHAVHGAWLAVWRCRQASKVVDFSTFLIKSAIGGPFSRLLFVHVQLEDLEGAFAGNGVRDAGGHHERATGGTRPVESAGTRAPCPRRPGRGCRRGRFPRSRSRPRRRRAGGRWLRKTGELPARHLARLADGKAGQGSGMVGGKVLHRVLLYGASVLFRHGHGPASPCVRCRCNGPPAFPPRCFPLGHSS